MADATQDQQPVGAALPDWQPALRPDGRQLIGRHCRLEKLALAHASDLFEAFADMQLGSSGPICRWGLLAP